jgi:hypothetical protein
MLVRATGSLAKIGSMPRSDVGRNLNERDRPERL